MLQIVEQPTAEAEKWVDLRVIAKHIGFGYQTTRRRVSSGELPGRPYKNGKKTYWRCLVSFGSLALNRLWRPD
jgi:hypothetical protein